MNACRRIGVWAAALLCATCLSTLPAQALMIGQIDTFQDLTTDNWFAGGLGLGQVPPVAPHVEPNGGPNGPGDAFLLVTAQGGGGPGSRLVTINATQWAGDYLGLGPIGISMDLRNFGATQLLVHLLFENPMGGPPTEEGVTTHAASLLVGSGWTHAFFPVAPAALNMVVGTDPAALLGNVTLLRVIHSTGGDAEPIAGILGIDNIRLAAVPAPGTLTLIALGLAAIALARRKLD